VTGWPAHPRPWVGNVDKGFPTNFVGGAKRRRLITGLCHVMFIGVILFLLLLVSVVVQQ